MDEQRDDIGLERVRSTGRNWAVPILTFVVGIFLGAAIVKPWDLVFPSSQPSVGRASTVSPPPTGGATLVPTPSPAGVPAECVFAGGWRVFAIAQPDRFGGDVSTPASPGSSPARFADIGNPLRRWLEVEPLSMASGPGDTRIPFVTIVSNRIGGISYCAPPDGADGPPAGATFVSWALDPSGEPTKLALRPVDLGPASTIAITVFIGSDRGEGLNERWLPGRYVFAVEGPDAHDYNRWFGVEIRTPPGKPLD